MIFKFIFFSALLISLALFGFAIAQEESSATSEEAAIDISKLSGEELDAAVKSAESEIARFNMEWQLVDSVDRPTAIIAASSATLVGMPALTQFKIKRGALSGDIVTFKIGGPVDAVAGVADSVQGPASAMTVESINLYYADIGGSIATIVVFTPLSISIEKLPANASVEQKRNFLKTAGEAIEQAEEIETPSKQPFRFLAELYYRWPIGIPALDKVVYENDTFTVFAIMPLDKIDDLFSDMVIELSRIASPKKVNLTPLIAPLIDGRDVVVELTKTGFALRWQGLDIVEINADKFLSFVSDRENTYFAYKISGVDKTGKPIGKIFIKSYELHNAKFGWQMEFFGDAPLTNLTFDLRDRLVFCRSNVLYSVGPKTGTILARRILAGNATEILISRDGGMSIEEKVVGDKKITERIYDEKIVSVPPPDSARTAADELMLSSLYNLIGSDSYEPSQSIDIVKLLQTNAETVMAKFEALREKDPLNPWYLFFGGVAKTAKTEGYDDSDFDECLKLPDMNPYDFMSIGRMFDRIGRHDYAIMAFEKAYKRFLNWYKPTDTIFKFSESAFAGESFKSAALKNDFRKIGESFESVRKFHPLAVGMDVALLELALLYEHAGSTDEYEKTMREYEPVSEKGYGLTLRWRLKAAIVYLLKIALFVSIAAFAALMILKYRIDRRRALESLNIYGLFDRFKFSIKSPANWFTYNTAALMTKPEKVTISILLVLLFAANIFDRINVKLADEYVENIKLFDTSPPAFALDLEKRDPSENNVESIYLIGLVYDNLSDGQTATRYYDTAIESVGNRESASRALNNKGVILFQKGENNAAEKLFKQACDLNEEMAECLYNLGIIGKNDELVKSAVAHGLPADYVKYFYGRPARAGIGNRLLMKAVMGYDSDALSLFSQNRGKFIAGIAALDSNKPGDTAIHYSLILLIFIMIGYCFAPTKPTRSDREGLPNSVKYALPGADAAFCDKPVIGVSLFFFFALAVFVLIFFAFPQWLSIVGSYLTSMRSGFSNADFSQILSADKYAGYIRNMFISILAIVPAINAGYLYHSKK